MESDGDNQNYLNTKAETVENSSKVAHDPGWNDPPKLLYGAMGQTKFIKKGLLNKRVAFPLNSTSQPAPSTSSISATPPKGDSLLLCSSAADSPADKSKSQLHNPLVIPLSLSTNDPVSPKYIMPHTLLGSSLLASEQKVDEGSTPQESSLEKVMHIFEEVISELVTPENFDKIEVDIRKRLEVMKRMWIEGKLSEAVQQKMMQLAEALQMGQGSVANDLHIEMIVDHTGQVSAWMPGVRKLVHYCMLASEKAQKVDDAGDASNEVDLVAERDDKLYSQQTTNVDKASE